MTDKEQLGHAIRQRREAMGLSRAALAELVGMRAATIAAIEEGSYGRRITAGHLFRLANAMGCTAAQLFHMKQSDPLP